MESLPPGYPDELWYGVIARHARFSGARSRAALRPKGGRSEPNSNPRGLLASLGLISSLSYERPAEVAQALLAKHSLLSLVWPFWSAGSRERFAGYIKAGMDSGLSVHYWHGLAPEPPTVQARELPFCVACAEEDVAADVHEAYWHRAHFLPNTLVCLRHDCWLSFHSRSTSTLATGPYDLRGGSSISSPLGSKRPPKEVSQLATLEAALESVGRTAPFLGFQLATVARSHVLGPSSAKVLSKRPLLHLLQDRLPAAILPWIFRDRKDRAPYKLLEGFTGLQKGTVSASIAVQCLFASQVTPDDVALVLSASRSGPVQFTVALCGTTRCRRISPDWSLRLRKHLMPGMLSVRAECDRCGFRAILYAGHETPKVLTWGREMLTLVEELAREGIQLPDIWRITGIIAAQVSTKKLRKMPNQKPRAGRKLKTESSQRVRTRDINAGRSAMGHWPSPPSSPPMPIERSPCEHR